MPILVLDLLLIEPLGCHPGLRHFCPCVAESYVDCSVIGSVMHKKNGHELLIMACTFCGSRFDDRLCYFCNASCCTSCMVDDRSRCKQCYVNKQRLGWKQIAKKNKLVLVFAGLLWIYAVFPGPFIPGLDPMFYTISVAAAVLIMIPICLALFFWSLNPPNSDLRRRKRGQDGSQ